MRRCKHICKPLQGNTKTKLCKRASASPIRDELFLKFPSLQKSLKPTRCKPIHNEQNTHWIIIANPYHIDFTNTDDRTPTGNSGLAKMAVQWLKV